MKAMVHSPEGNTDSFEMVASVLQGDTLAQFLFKNYLLGAFNKFPDFFCTGM